METNIPIYRAKKIDSNEYVEGYLVSNLVSNSNGMPPEVYYNIQNSLFYKYRIDPATLAIHFPDMIDSQGNKIFASLQKDGKGGDIIKSEFKHKCTVKYKEYFFYADNEEIHINCFGFKNSKVIGIQQ
jgi:hypothetical protein